MARVCTAKPNFKIMAKYRTSEEFQERPVRTNIIRDKYTKELITKTLCGYNEMMAFPQTRRTTKRYGVKY